MDVMTAFFAELEMLGPHDEATSLKVLNSIGALPAAPRVLDLGCGTGQQSLMLARALGTRVVAVDLSEVFLQRVRTHFAVAGMPDLVETRAADMRDPGEPLGSVDLIWSEGAAYNIGFRQALNAWRPILRPGGVAVIADAGWLTEAAPAPVRTFWDAEYPDMHNAADFPDMAAAEGYEVVATEMLPASAWVAYYDGVLKRATRLRATTVGPDMETLIRELEQEAEIFHQSAGSYSYVFTAVRRPSD